MREPTGQTRGTLQHSQICGEQSEQRNKKYFWWQAGGHRRKKSHCPSTPAVNFLLRVFHLPQVFEDKMWTCQQDYICTDSS